MMRIINKNQKKETHNKTLVFFPTDPIQAYIDKGFSYEKLESYYNPLHFFDKVYCLSPWGETKTINGINYIKANPLKYKRIIKKIKPDVVRGYGGALCADWISISKVKNIPFVVSTHDTNPDYIRPSLKYADFIISVSSIVKNEVIRLIGYDPNNIYVLPNRVDTNVFTKKYDISFFAKLSEMFGEGKHLLHIGRKEKQKNIETVIESLRFLPNYSCVFVGRGDVAFYQEYAKKCGDDIYKRCFFVNSVPNNELPYWYSWADVFVTPSLWEGFGIVFIEAASTETAIVTSNIAPMNEFLKNEVNSILVDDYTNPQEIAKAVMRIESDEDFKKSLQKKARAVATSFSKENVDQMEVSIYEQIINSSVNYSINNKLRSSYYKRALFKMIKKIHNKINSMLKK